MLKPGDRANFETLWRACLNGDVALMECTTKEGKYVAVVCAVHGEGDEIVTTPLAKLFEGNPYDEVLPPT